METNIELMKEKVGSEACKYIESNSTIGLGSGSTVKYLIQHIGENLRKKYFENIEFVCSSIETEKVCTANNINFSQIEDIESINGYIDGADEITNSGFAIKGLGGALTREKILRKMSNNFIVIVTSNKLVSHLGIQAPLPVEILQFGYNKTMKQIIKIKNENFNIKDLILRKIKNTDEPFITDNYNYLADIFFDNPLKSEKSVLLEINNSLKSLTGVVETGLFLDPADTIIIGDIVRKDIRIIENK